LPLSTPSPTPATAAPAAASPIPAASSTPAAAPAAAAAVERPAYVPEKYWDSAKNEVRADDFSKDYNDLSAFKAEQEIKKSLLPKTADEYKVELPKDFKAPEGVNFEFNKDDPLLAHARTLAHQRGIDQDTFSNILGVYAANEIARASQLNTSRAAELQKLGATADQRIGNVETWLSGRVGDKAAPLVAQLKAFPHAGMVEAFESIIQQFSSQGGAQFDQRHRANEQNEGKIPGYENMDFKARRMAQMQQKAAGGGR
jgi:hypothetical protein